MDDIQGDVDGLFRCADGKLRWNYEMNMWKNLMIFWTMVKVFGGIVLGMAVMMFFVKLGDGAAEAGAFFLQFFGYGTLLALALLIPSYAILAIRNGGKYCVLFEMDETGVSHTQLPSQFHKAQVVAELAMQVGIATGKPGVTGAGILAMTKGASVSTFKNVRKVVRKRAFNTILVNEPLEHNQVYASREQFDCIFDYIVAHCTNAKVRR